MPIKTNDYSIKFNQYDLIKHIQKNTHDEFIKKIIGIDNIRYIYGGLCYGLTDRFLVNAYKNKEIAFIQQLIASFNVPPSPSTHHGLSMNQQEQHLYYKNKAYFNELFHDIFKAQFNQNIFADLQNTIHQFTYPPINKKEEIFDYMNRVIDKNIRKIGISKKALKPYFHQLKALLSQVNKAIRTPSIQSSTIENNTNFQTFIERVKYSCLNPQKNGISNNKIKLFFYYSAKYLAKEVLNKTIIYNEITGASYSPKYQDIKDYNIDNHKETITLKELKSRIDKATNERKVLACDLCNKDHAMAIIVQPLPYNNKIGFELFDPNKGLLVTNKKRNFIELINRIVNKKNSNFIKNNNGEKCIEITRCFIINKP